MLTCITFPLQNLKNKVMKKNCSTIGLNLLFLPLFSLPRSFSRDRRRERSLSRDRNHKPSRSFSRSRRYDGLSLLKKISVVPIRYLKDKHPTVKHNLIFCFLKVLWDAWQHVNQITDMYNYWHLPCSQLWFFFSFFFPSHSRSRSTDRK